MNKTQTLSMVRDKYSQVNIDRLYAHVGWTCLARVIKIQMGCKSIHTILWSHFTPHSFSISGIGRFLYQVVSVLQWDPVSESEFYFRK